MDFPLPRIGLQLKYLGLLIPFATIFIVLGASPSLAVFLCLIGWALISRVYTGKELATNLASLRDYYDLLGWRFGTWQKMPPLVGVTLKYFSVLNRRIPVAMSWGTWQNSTQRLEEIVIMLSVQNSSQGVIIGRTSVERLAETITAATRLASHWNVPFNNYLPAQE